MLCSEHAHSAADKAANLLELELRKVPVDESFRMRPEAVDLDGACALVATIGTTGAAAVDPVPALADLCAEAGVWLHVDAAYAGPAAVCPELRHHFAGWERADSIGVNPHKWLGDADGLLGALDAPARRLPAARSASFRSSCSRPTTRST